MDLAFAADFRVYQVLVVLVNLFVVKIFPTKNLWNKLYVISIVQADNPSRFSAPDR